MPRKPTALNRRWAYHTDAAFERSCSMRAALAFAFWASVLTALGSGVAWAFMKVVGG